MNKKPKPEEDRQERAKRNLADIQRKIRDFVPEALEEDRRDVGAWRSGASSSRSAA